MHNRSLYLEFNHRLDSKQDHLLHIVVITGKYLVIDITGSIELVHEIPTYITIDTSTDIDTICHQYNKAGSFSNSDFREQDMRLFQINKLEEWVINEMKPFFEDLPETNHKDGKYRLRRYSVVKPHSAGHLLPTEYHKLDINSFNQSSDYNDFQGDVERVFEPLSDDFIANAGFVNVCNLFSCMFQSPPSKPLEIHQMRVLTKEGGKLSPEGIHQDGFDHIAMIGIHRENITGGHMLLYREKDGDPVVDMPLENGDIAFLNDKDMWHNGSPVKKIDKKKDAYMDFLVILSDLNKDYDL